MPEALTRNDMLIVEQLTFQHVGRSGMLNMGGSGASPMVQ